VREKLTERTLLKHLPAAKPYEVFDSEQRGLLLRVQPSGVRTFYFAFATKDGQRRRYKLGDADGLTVAIARELARRAAGEVAAGGDPQEAREKARAEAARREAGSLGKFLDGDYTAAVVPTLKDGAAQLSRLKACFPHLLDRPMADIHEWDVRTWVAKRVKEGVSPATLNRDVGALKSALRAALKRGLIEAHPLVGLKPLRVDKGRKPRALTADEKARLLAAARQRDARKVQARASANAWRARRGYELLPVGPFGDHLLPMIEVSLLTGLRRGELFQLDWRAIDLQRRRLTVVGTTAKSQQTRVIPLHARAVEILTKLEPKPDGPVFRNRDGTPVGSTKTAWKRLTKAANLRAGWHAMRHTFATDLLNGGAPVTVVKDLMGHASLSTTARYLHATEEQRQSAVEALA
jgi:integrase